MKSDSKRRLSWELRMCSMPSAPICDQVMPPCFMRPPTTFLQALSTVPLPIGNLRRLYLR